MPNQIDKLTFRPPPSGGTFDLAIDPSGADETATGIAWNASQTDLENAIDTATSNSGGDTVALLSTDASLGFTNTYGGGNANKRLSTWACDASGLTALATAGGIAGGATGAPTLTITLPDGTAAGNYEINAIWKGNQTGLHDYICAWDDPNDAAVALNGIALSYAVTELGGQAVTWSASGPPGGPYTLTATAGNPLGWAITTTSGGSYTPLNDNANGDGTGNATGDPTPSFTDSTQTYTLYSLATVATATGGTFALGAAGGSAVAGIAYDVDPADLATDLSTATALTFTYTSGSGTQADPWLFTCSTLGPVAVPTVDWSGLTQGVVATVSTVVQGQPIVAEPVSMLLGIGVWI